jgi:hypothetical protein
MDADQAESMILKNLALHGGTGNVMEFLKYDASEFDNGFAIANNMQNKDLLKILYSNFNKNLVVVEATLLGLAAAKNK